MYQVVSQAEASGRVQAVRSLAEVQGAIFDAPTVLVADELGGNEDIPVLL